MLPLEHSAILLTCIKPYLVMKIIFALFSGRLRQVFLFVPVTEILILCESATTSAGYSIGISCTNCCPGFVEISTGMFFSLVSPLGYEHT